MSTFTVSGGTKSNVFQRKRPSPVKNSSQNGPNDGGGSLIDPSWETVDPCPDVHALFQQYNQQFFYGKLSGCEVKWSPRMTRCAGICSYEGFGGLCSVRLSKPLLSLRPRSDLVETLLHEMIHAYLFVTANNKDRDGHGPEFQKHMQRINGSAGTNITIYHTFHDEVRHHLTHWWRCEGPCRDRKPYYGWVKRSMNRAPGPNDNWWKDHVNTCNGKFVKVKEPEDYGAKKKKNSSQQQQPSSSTSSTSNSIRSNNDKTQRKISSFFGNDSSSGSSSVSKHSSSS